MAINIIKPSLTNEMIVQLFVRLVQWETKKRVSQSADRREGQQDGYLMCLIDFVGIINTNEVLKIVKTIVDSKLQSFLIAAHTSWDDFDDATRQVTEEYLAENAHEVTKSLHK